MDTAIVINADPLINKLLVFGEESRFCLLHSKTKLDEGKPTERWVEGSKRPIGEAWQDYPFTLHDATQKLGKNYKGAKVGGLGLILGELTGLVAVDVDGQSAQELLEKNGWQLPETITLSSGRHGHYQAIYRVPEPYRSLATNPKVILTGIEVEEFGKKCQEQLDIRWGEAGKGVQSVVYGTHPETGNCYQVFGDRVADAPDWLIDLMMEGHRKAEMEHQDMVKAHETFTDYRGWSDREWATKEYLPEIEPHVSGMDWYGWRDLMFACHSSGLSEGEALAFSAKSSKHTDQGFKDVWRNIKGNPGHGIAYLGKVAKSHGYVKPSERNQKNNSKAPLSGSSPQISSINSEDEEVDLETIKEEITKLLEVSDTTLSLDSILPSKLAAPFSVLAGRLGVPESVFLAVLLPVLASLLKSGTRIVVDRSTDFKPPCILWTGIVAESGAVKSPVFKTVMKPLWKMQFDKAKEDQTKQEQYEQALENWESSPKGERGKKPTPYPATHYYFDEATTESLISKCSKQPDRGVIWAVDELSGLITGQNQYKKGKGNDRQRLLSLYEGIEIKTDRKGEESPLPAALSVSITGTIQPTILRKLMGDLEEVDGLWARFAWVDLPLTEMPPPEEGDFVLGELLEGIYKKLDSFPPKEIDLDHQAKKLWREWHIWTERKKVEEPQPTLRAIYPKARERAARIADVLHHLEAACSENVEVRETISSDTLRRGIRAAKFMIQKTKLIYADFGLVDHPDSIRATKFVKKFAGKGWINAAIVRKWWPARVKPKTSECREFMKLVKDLGFATDQGEGKDYQIKIPEGSQFSQFSGQSPSESGNNGSQKCSQSVVNRSQKVVSFPNQENCSSEETPKTDEKLTKTDYQLTTKLTTVNPALEEDSSQLLTKLTTDLEKQKEKPIQRGTLSAGRFVVYTGEDSNLKKRFGGVVLTVLREEVNGWVCKDPSGNLTPNFRKEYLELLPMEVSA